MSDGNERDDLILRWLELTEADAKRDLVKRKDAETIMRTSHEAAAQRAREDDTGNPLLLGTPEAASVELTQIARAQLELASTATSHDDAKRSVTDQLDVIDRIQRQRTQIESDKTQRSNLTLQRCIALGTIGSMGVAVVAVVVAIIALVK
jgi:hypothetical protein